MAVERIVQASPVPAGGSVVASSFQYLLTGEERLLVTVRWFARALVGGVTVAGRSWRSQTNDLSVFLVNTAQSPTTGSQPSSTNGNLSAEITLDAGALLNLRVSTDDMARKLGTCFVRVQLQRGSGTAATVLGTLLQGYISPGNDLGWPGSALTTMHAGRGVVLSEIWSFQPGPLRATATVPAGIRWLPIAGAVQFTCSGVAGDRQVIAYALDDAGTIVWEGVGAPKMIAGVTANYGFGAGQPPSTVDVTGIRELPWPDELELAAGWSLRIQVSGADAGDIVTPFGLLVREWLDE